MAAQWAWSLPRLWVWGNPRLVPHRDGVNGSGRLRFVPVLTLVFAALVALVPSDVLATPQQGPMTIVPRTADIPEPLSGSPVFLRISGGPVSGTYFQMADVLAGIVSHPPGSARCLEAGRCGPAGLIAVAQASEGSVRNVVEVNSGAVDTALAQADIVRWAASGTRLFARVGVQDRLRAIATLYPETVHLVARFEAPLVSLADLKGKRVSIDRPGSGTNATARLIFETLGLEPADIDLVTLSPSRAAAELASGQIDAFFFTAGAPVSVVARLIEQGHARLVPLSGPAIEELTRIHSVFQITPLAEGVYPGQPEIPTLTVGALWITHVDMPNALIEALTSTLWHDNNRPSLIAGHPSGAALSLEKALNGLPIPVHPGAAAYYRAAGMLDENGQPTERNLEPDPLPAEAQPPL